MQDRAARIQGLSVVFHVSRRYGGEEANLSYHTVEVFTYSLISTRASMNLKGKIPLGLFSYQGYHTVTCYIKSTGKSKLA